MQKYQHGACKCFVEFFRVDDKHFSTCETILKLEYVQLAQLFLHIAHAQISHVEVVSTIFASIYSPTQAILKMRWVF